MRRLHLLLVLALLLAPALARAGELRVYFFDVGQGDAALILSPAGRSVLLDAGPPEAAARLRARLEQLLSGPLDLAILTHAHADHLGGMQEALGVRGARLFMDSGFEHPSPSYEALLGYVQAHRIEMVNASAGRAIDLGGGASLQLLAPTKPFLAGTASDANANSVVARLAFGKVSVLFMGDAEPETEAALLKAGLVLQSDVLKVSHHGARTSSTAAFLQAVHPSTAVISCGAGNPFGMPSRLASDRLEAAGAHVLRTDLDGEIRLISDGKTLQLHASGEPAATVAMAMPSEVPAPPEHAAKRDRRGKRVEGATPIDRLADEARPASSAGAERGSHKDRERAPPTAKVVSMTHAGGKYVASQKSQVFHFADCPWAKRIKPENLTGFDTREEALASGRHPAGCCNP